MSLRQQDSQVRELSPSEIERNPENPRLIFRPEELDSLLSSISRYGIQVPITVYKERDKFVLIDGERRWRCARKLNLKKIPALVQRKPSPLDNLLLMFNIHALREQWDYLTIANKLPRVISLYKAQHDGIEPNEIELSQITGLTRGQIRRCRILLDLPERYRRILLTELELPKGRQRLSEDFFIEMERAIRTIVNRIPSAVSNIDKVRAVLIEKYRTRKIDNVTDFRKLSKIATSVKGLGVDEFVAETAIKQIFSSKGPGIAEIFEEQFGYRYDEKKIGRQVEALTNYLESIDEDSVDELDSIGLMGPLEKLREELNRLLGGG